MADDAINKLVARCCQLERMEKRREERRERERHSIGNFLITNAQYNEAAAVSGNCRHRSLTEEPGKKASEASNA